MLTVTLLLAALSAPDSPEPRIPSNIRSYLSVAAPVSRPQPLTTPQPLPPNVIITDAPRPEWVVDGVVIAGQEVPRTEPQLVFHSIPPRAALFAGCENHRPALIRLKVAASGYVTDVDFLRSTQCRGADRLIKEAAINWLLTPATRNGRPCQGSFVVSMPTDHDE